MSYILAVLAQHVGATIQGDSNITITGIAPLHSAKLNQISFLDNPIYKKYLTETNASAVILAPQYANMCPITALIVDNPYLAYAKIATLFTANNETKPGIHPTAIIDSTAEIAQSVSIGPYCIIGPQVTIDEQTIIGANCYIGEDTHIGRGCHLAPRVTIYKNTKIGHNVIIHSGAVIASDGFGYANDQGQWFKIPQLGGVEIMDEVEIGANTCIDRGALNNTLIGKGVKLDNLVQIAHNVVIGDYTAIAGCVGIAGSTKIGSYCMIGGATGISGHLEITDRVYLTGMSMVTQSIEQPGIYSSGTSLLPNNQWHKSVIRFKQLDKLARKVHKLERYLEDK